MGVSVTLQGKTSRSELMANKQIPWYFVNAVCFSGICWLALFTCFLSERENEVKFEEYLERAQVHIHKERREKESFQLGKYRFKVCSILYAHKYEIVQN